MIEYIQKIGAYVAETDTKKLLVDLMVEQIIEDRLDSVFIIVVLKEGVRSSSKFFYPEVSLDALLYSDRNTYMGGGIRLDHIFKNGKNETEILKEFKKKLIKACEFCEISSRVEDIFEEVDKCILDKKISWNVFLLIKIEGKTPRELYEKKFLDKMLKTVYKKIAGNHICHICSKKGEVFNTAVYKFFTNDKKIYSIFNKGKNGFSICSNCLKFILYGKNYINKYHSCMFVGSLVMFLPHEYNSQISQYYNHANNKTKEGASLLRSIKENEDMVFNEIGKSNSTTDIVFYEYDFTKKTFVINYHIQSILPSKFSEISKYLKEYSLNTYKIFNYLTMLKSKYTKKSTLDSEKAKILRDIFYGRRIDRIQFFKRCMDVYKNEYLNNNQRYCISDTLRIYNFLIKCKCLQGRCIEMKNYSNYNELFEQNSEYFCSNEKRAWFLLGRVFNTVNSYIKNKIDIPNNKEEVGNKESQNIAESLKDTRARSSMDKIFFFSRKFDKRDFLYFCNLINDKIEKYKSAPLKYSLDSVWLKDEMFEMKAYYAKAENKLSKDEAKFIFFWGKDSYFEDKSKKTTKNNEGIQGGN